MNTTSNSGNNSAFAVSAIVTSLVAGWFLFAAGAIAAGPAPERSRAAPETLAVTLVPEAAVPAERRMTLTVVAKRPAPVVRTASARVSPTI